MWTPFILTAMALAMLVPLAGRMVAGEQPSGAEEEQADTTLAGAAVPRVSREQAQQQAKLLHAAMHSTLQVVHHQYYREDEGLALPAATLLSVFSELKEDQHVSLRWLAVEGQAMNTDHQPRNAFERDAVAALKAGKSEFARTEAGIFRRAGAITLGSHCLKCHVPDRKTTESRTAGLIIAIPVHD